MNRCDLLQVKIQPTHRSGMGLKAINPKRECRRCWVETLRQAQGSGSVSELAELCVISCSGCGFSFLFGQ